MYKIRLYDLNRNVINLKGSCFTIILKQFFLNLIEQYNITKEEIEKIMEEIINENER